MGSITGRAWKDAPDTSTPIMAADLEAIEAAIEAAAESGGGGSLTPITADTTPADGTAAGQLVGYVNTGSNPVTVAGETLEPLTPTVFWWTGSEWLVASSGSSKMPAPTIVVSSITGSSAVVNYSGAAVVPTAWRYRLNGGTPAPLDGTSPDTITGLTSDTQYTIGVSYSDGTTWSSWASATFSTPFVVTYQSTVLADEPDVYLPLDDAAGTTAPRVLGSRAGTTSITGGGITFGAPGLGDGPTSANFDKDTAASSYITAQFSTAIPAGNVTAGTFEAILAPSLPVTGTGSRMAYISNSGNRQANFNSYANFQAFGTQAGINKGIWETDVPGHYVATYDGTTVRYYKNGQQVATADKSPWADANLGGMIIGHSATSWAGRIAGFAFYNKALSAERVLAHAQAAGYAT